MSPHRHDVRVYFEDTDAGGVVYHARYLGFAERARSEALRDAGVPHSELVRDGGLIFVVRRVKIDYLRPARLDDILTIATEPTHLGAATATMRQEFTVAGVDGARREVGLACGRLADGRPARIPSRWRAAFEAAQSRE